MRGRNGSGVSGTGGSNSSVTSFDQNSINVPNGGSVTFSGTLNNLPESIDSYSVNITCSGPNGLYSLPVNQSGTSWTAAQSVPANTACFMAVNAKRNVSSSTSPSGTSQCPGYTISTCDVGSCVLRPASSCDDVSTCAPEFGCGTTIGVDVTPMSRTVAPGGTASYDVEVSQNFTTSAPIYDIHLYSSMNHPGTSITWEIPSDQASKASFVNSSTTGNNVLIKMKEPRAIIRMNVVTTTELALGTKVFFVTADPGAETCYGQCNAIKSQINLVVQNGMTGTLTPRSNSCVIARGASTCNINFDWHVTNPVVFGGSAVTKNPNLIVGTGDNKTNIPFLIKWGGDTFYLYNNGVLLDRKTVDAASVTCASGTSWNGSVCAVPTNPTPCANGATNPPACNNNTPGACTNGATNPPACNNNPNTTCANGASEIY
jgi:hypothetical protein